MRTLASVILASLSLAAAAVPAHAQGSRLPQVTPARKKQVEEAADRLRKAGENFDAAKAGRAAEGVVDKLPPKLTDAAKSALESGESKKEALDALKSAAGTLLPEAQRMMRGDAAPAAAAPRIADAPPGPVESGPKPMPLQPLPDLAAAVRETGTITIDSDDAVFDLKAGIFIYRGNVRARHPEFYIECEELEVHMVVDDPDAPPPKEDAIRQPAKAKEKESGIKKAIARGRMVTIEKISDTGEMQQGKCRRAVYDASTGQITMSDFPQVVRGNVLQAATSPSTTMVFDQKGVLTTNGPSKTDVLSGGESASGRPGSGGR